MRPEILVVLLLTSVVHAHDLDSEATYLGNAGVLVAHGDIQIAFDPLFDEDFGTYDRVPDDVEQQLMHGESPFNSLDAIFVSHYHDDHFDASLIAKALSQRPALHVFAPRQAVDAVLQTDASDSVRDRLHAIDLSVDGQSMQQSREGFAFEAVRLPHAGWPDRHAHVENIVFRVTLAGDTSVVHLGDATTQETFYASTDAFWQRRESSLALPPYWFFLTEDGRYVIEKYINSPRVIGVHVPTSIPDNANEREDALKDVTLFTEPGEKVSLP